jgi:hypothetical protein
MVFWICLVSNFFKTSITFLWRVYTQLPLFFCLGGCAKPLGAPLGTGMKNFVIILDYVYKNHEHNSLLKGEPVRIG